MLASVATDDATSSAQTTTAQGELHLALTFAGAAATTDEQVAAATKKSNVFSSLAQKVTHVVTKKEVATF